MEKLLRIDEFKVDTYLNLNTNKEGYKCVIKATLNYGIVEQPIKSEGRSVHKGRATSMAYENLFKSRIEDDSREQIKHIEEKYQEIPYMLNAKDIDFNDITEAKDEFLDYVSEYERR